LDPLDGDGALTSALSKLELTAITVIHRTDETQATPLRFCVNGSAAALPNDGRLFSPRAPPQELVHGLDGDSVFDSECFLLTSRACVPCSNLTDLFPGQLG
jgi:hypothetical protein